MNLYLDQTYDPNFFSKDVYLGHYQDNLFEYLDSFVDNSLIFNITYFSPKTLAALKEVNLGSFKYIFILDIIDPPEYLDKWSHLRDIFINHMDKTFYVSCVHKNPYFKTIYFDAFLHFGTELVKEIDCSRTYKRKFLSLNANSHPHRLYLLKKLYDKNLLKDGYVSGYLSYYSDNWKSNLPSLHDMLTDDFLSIFPLRVEEDLISIRSMEGDDSQENSFYSIIPAAYSSPVNIVAETSIYNDSIFITEKTLKSLISKQITMLVGNPMTYSFLTSKFGLKNYGFDFEPRIASQPFEYKIDFYCDFIKETTLQDLKLIHKEKEDILEYNKNRILNHFKDISYNLFLTSLKKHGIIPL